MRCHISTRARRPHADPIGYAHDYRHVCTSTRITRDEHRAALHRPLVALCAPTRDAFSATYQARAPRHAYARSVVCRVDSRYAGALAGFPKHFAHVEPRGTGQSGPRERVPVSTAQMLSTVLLLRRPPVARALPQTLLVRAPLHGTCRADTCQAAGSDGGRWGRAGARRAGRALALATGRQPGREAAVGGGGGGELLRTSDPAAVDTAAEHVNAGGVRHVGMLV